MTGTRRMNEWKNRMDRRTDCDKSRTLCLLTV